MDHRTSLTSSPPRRVESPACAASRRSLGWVSCCAAPGLLPVLPALRGPSPPARQPWRGSLITVTRDGSGGSGRDQRAGTSPILGRYRTGPGPLRVALAAVSRAAGRCAPPGPAPAHRTPQPPRLSGPRRRPGRRPERRARWHLVRSRARRRRSGGSGSPRRCVPARPVLAAGGAPGCGSGCGGRFSP